MEVRYERKPDRKIKAASGSELFDLCNAMRKPRLTVDPYGGWHGRCDFSQAAVLRLLRPAIALKSHRQRRAGLGHEMQARAYHFHYGLRRLTPGSVLHLRNVDWTVTGVFTTNGDVHESELLADVDTVGSAIERPGYSSAVGLLTGASEFATFIDQEIKDYRNLITSAKITLD